MFFKLLVILIIVYFQTNLRVEAGIPLLVNYGAKKGVDQQKIFYYQNVKPSGDKVRSIRLFGGGKVGNTAIHHVFVMLEYDSYYRLLELKKEKSTITIKDNKGSFYGLIDGRFGEAEKWGDTEYVSCYDSVINRVIEDYNGSLYVGWFILGTTKNCRTFVNDLFRACGSSRVADETGFGDFIGIE